MGKKKNKKGKPTHNPKKKPIKSDILIWKLRTEGQKMPEQINMKSYIHKNILR